MQGGQPLNIQGNPASPNMQPNLPLQNTQGNYGGYSMMGQNQEESKF